MKYEVTRDELHQAWANVTYVIEADSKEDIHKLLEETL